MVNFSHQALGQLCVYIHSNATGGLHPLVFFTGHRLFVHDLGNTESQAPQEGRNIVCRIAMRDQPVHTTAFRLLLYPVFQFTLHQMSCKIPFKVIHTGYSFLHTHAILTIIFSSYSTGLPVSCLYRSYLSNTVFSVFLESRSACSSKISPNIRSAAFFRARAASSMDANVPR